MLSRTNFAVALVAVIASVSLASRRSPSSPQTSSIVVTVVDSLGNYPLPNADVFDIASGQHRFTNESGRTVLTWPTERRLNLRVREVGYQPRQRTLQQSVAGGATTFAMTKVAYALSTVLATSRCSTKDTTSLDLSVAVLDQLQQGAEKYNEFRRTYPFDATVERRTAAVPEAGPVKRIIVNKETFRSDRWESRYKPGDIIEWSSGNYTIPILFLSTLADSVFWEHHCFIARGIESYRGTRVVRLEFSPSNDVKGPDYYGSALLDSATSYLLRIDFHLANARRDNGPTKLDGYTTFTSPSPFVMIPDSTLAVWWVRDADNGNWGNPEFAQSLHVDSLRYRKQKPLAYQIDKH
jgi:hypothetical protein